MIDRDKVMKRHAEIVEMPDTLSRIVLGHEAIMDFVGEVEIGQGTHTGLWTMEEPIRKWVITGLDPVCYAEDEFEPDLFGHMASRHEDLCLEVGHIQTSVYGPGVWVLTSLDPVCYVQIGQGWDREHICDDVMQAIADGHLSIAEVGDVATTAVDRSSTLWQVTGLDPVCYCQVYGLAHPNDRYDT